jgi:hypothetical protein
MTLTLNPTTRPDTYPLIIKAVITEAMRYETPNRATPQVTDITRVCNYGDYQFYAVTVRTFRSISAFDSYYSVWFHPVTGEAEAVPASDRANAVSSCHHMADSIRAQDSADLEVEE